jgi:orotidine-5'-phosphate decarboxylase
MTFCLRLQNRIKEFKTPILLGLDPRAEMLPEDCFKNNGRTLENIADAFYNFGIRLIDALSTKVAAIKPQIAFYEALGIPGLTAYQKTIEYASSKGVIVIADIKRGDIGSTAEAYAQAHLGSKDTNDGPFEADAVTLNPWLGIDSLEPFFERVSNKDKGVYLLLHTSNPGSKDLQETKTANNDYLYEHLASLILSWQKGLGENGKSIGVVLGATFPEQLKNMHELLKDTPLLIPGYGAQGGTGKDLNFLFKDKLGPHLINASRSLTYAYKKYNTSLEEGAILATEEMKKDLLGDQYE